MWQYTLWVVSSQVCSVVYARIALAVLRWRISAEDRMVWWLTISNIKFGSLLYFLCSLMHGLYSGHWFLGMLLLPISSCIHFKVILLYLAMPFVHQRCFCMRYKYTKNFYLNNFLSPIIRAMKSFSQVPSGIMFVLEIAAHVHPLFL